MTSLSAGSRVRSGQTRPGLALLKKPRDITSFQALSPLKRAASSGKVGHAGTLDRFAEGLLVALVGSYSRLAPYVQAGEKRYIGVMRLGSQTATLDPEGEVVAEAPVPSREALESVLPRFRGRIMQRPPAYSAVHIAGKRAYELALKGALRDEEPELKEREVDIRELSLLSYEGGLARIEVRCSSGTYIRSLARDIAAASGSCAYLIELKRLSIGPYSVEDAVLPENFDLERDLRAFGPSDAIALGLAARSLPTEALALRFSNGGVIEGDAFASLSVSGAAPDHDSTLNLDSAVFGPDGTFLGIAQIEKRCPRYKFVMPLGEGSGA